MGLCLPCLQGTSDDQDAVPDPGPEARRQQQLAAAEKRKQDAEGRGVKDAEAVKRKQEKKEEMEKQADAGGEKGGLRWQVG